jgi:hypothetical protein
LLDKKVDDLTNPYNKRIVKQIPALDIFNAKEAKKSGKGGVDKAFAHVNLVSTFLRFQHLEQLQK